MKIVKSLNPSKNGLFGGPYLEQEGGRGAKMLALLFSKIINAVTFKLNTKVAHLKYFKKI